jgi:hypothetical protein
VGRLRCGGDRIGGGIAAAIRELSVQRQDRVERVMDRDMHHGVSANAFEREELILRECDLVNGLVPCDGQSRIDEERGSQLTERRVLLRSDLIERRFSHVLRCRGGCQ